MDYFSILNLNKEPFSNSPDPEYFFNSQQHQGCLQKLELSIRLRRGLNVVIGDVGTGKTTLCRQLIRRFADDQDCETHLILDPSFSTPSEFLATAAGMLAEERSASGTNDWQVKESIKQVIFQKGVDEKKTVVLIIDEGQKIPEFCLEILREFLNFETNEYKLLQIVIFAQKEFENSLDLHANLADRINLFHLLEPLNFRDTMRMIQFRIKQSSRVSVERSFFSYPALWQIYRVTRGYPRKIVNLCHRIVLAMIIQNRTKAGWRLVRSSASRIAPEPVVKWRRVFVTVLVLLATASIAVGLAPGRFKLPVKWISETVREPARSIEPIQAEKRSETTNSGAETVKLKEPPSVRRGTVEKIATSGPLNPGLTLKTAAIKETGEPLPEATVPEKNPPLVLGQVTLKRNETLWRLIEKVYGVFDDQYLESLKAVNPHIDNPNRVETGRLISVPAIPARVKPLASKVWWVKVCEKEQLKEAIELLRAYPEAAPSIRLLPYWNKRELKFVILLREYFYNEADAGRQIERLPLETGAEASILSSWEKDIVFYADPFRVPRR
jgi:general secretion pathway protein A